MSAYIVSDDTLDLLVSALVAWDDDSRVIYLQPWQSNPLCLEDFVVSSHSGGVRTIELNSVDADYIKKELLAQNIVSVIAHYGSTEGFLNEHQPFRIVPESQASLAELAGAVSCYDYQACESDTWSTSFAKALCLRLQNDIIGRVSRPEANWSYTRPENRKSARF